MATSTSTMSMVAKVMDIAPNWVYVVACISASLALRKNKVPATFAILGVGIRPQLVQVSLRDLVTPKSANSKDVTDELRFGRPLGGRTSPRDSSNPVDNRKLHTSNGIAEPHIFFPRNCAVTAKRLFMSVGTANLASSILGGIPVCHGAGGLVGHYIFGARICTATLFMGLLLVATSFLHGGKFAIALRQIPPRTRSYIILRYTTTNTSELVSKLDLNRLKS